MSWKKPQELRRDLFEQYLSDRIGNLWANGPMAGSMTIGENKTC